MASNALPSGWGTLCLMTFTTLARMRVTVTSTLKTLQWILFMCQDLNWGHSHQLCTFLYVGLNDAHQHFSISIQDYWHTSSFGCQRTSMASSFSFCCSHHCQASLQPPLPWVTWAVWLCHWSPCFVYGQRKNHQGQVPVLDICQGACFPFLVSRHALNKTGTSIAHRFLQVSHVSFGV